MTARYNWQAKAEALIRQGMAKDFYEACSMLASRRRRQKATAPMTVDPTKIRLPYADN